MVDSFSLSFVKKKKKKRYAVIDGSRMAYFASKEAYIANKQPQKGKSIDLRGRYVEVFQYLYCTFLIIEYRSKMC